jgi:hypothetical protein
MAHNGPSPGLARETIGLREVLVPDAHGGNMDTPEMRAGTTCYLGVNVKGAAEAPVANVVDPNYTFVSKLRKDLLPAQELYAAPTGACASLGRDYLAGRA